MKLIAVAKLKLGTYGQMQWMATSLPLEEKKENREEIQKQTQKRSPQKNSACTGSLRMLSFTRLCPCRHAGSRLSAHTGLPSLRSPATQVTVPPTGCSRHLVLALGGMSSVDPPLLSKSSFYGY